MFKKLKNFALLNIGTLLLSMGVYFFKIPNGFSTGGVSGIATILGKLFENVSFLKNWLTPGLIIIILNVLLLIVGFIFVNKQFGFYTVYCTLMYSGLTYLFEWIFPLSAPLTDQPFLELIYAIMLTAIGSAILFNVDASSGGTDIIAMILKKYTHIHIGIALLIADSIVAFSSFFVFHSMTVGLYSVLGLFMKSFLVDGIIENLNMCKFFTIITEKPDEICEYIMTTMHRGVTKYDAEGAYSHREKKVLLAVCRKYEARMLKKKINEIDPTAFIMITNSSEILGKGFDHM